MVLSVAAMLMFAGWTARGLKESAARKTRQNARVQLRQGGYYFINPLLDCELGEEFLGGLEIHSFKDKIEKLIKVTTSKYSVTHVSVYFRDLNNGPWFVINEQTAFSPASLLKVPLMVAWFKLAESDPKVLSRKITYGKNEPNLNIFLNVKPSQSLSPGGSYTVDELIYRMIVYSDNNANDLLFKNIDNQALLRTYRELGVEAPVEGVPEEFMGIHEYAAIFRILFNASYLSREMSEKALFILSQSEFKAGIVAGVPPGIPVAHKFGERTLPKAVNVKSLHDCGIVYYPTSAYLLCVMTNGADFQVLDDVIREISSAVFQEVDRHEKSIQPQLTPPRTSK